MTPERAVVTLSHEPRHGYGMTHTNEPSLTVLSPLQDVSSAFAAGVIAGCEDGGRLAESRTELPEPTRACDDPGETVTSTVVRNEHHQLRRSA